MGPNKQNRLFITTFFEDENKNLSDLIDKLNLESGDDLRVVPIEKIHITWRFIGDIGISENKRVFNIVKEYSKIIKDCFLVFDKLEVWPSLEKPSVLTLTATNYDRRFKVFFNSLEESLYKILKIRKEKGRFIPHITIARIKNNKDISLLKNLDFDPIRLDVKHTRVMQSITNPSGAEYKVLYEERL